MIITFSGPSGAGKSSILKVICSHYNISIIPSWTTRLKRQDDIDLSYNYLSLQTYLSMSKNNQFAFEEKIGSTRYGTTYSDINNAIKDSKLWIADFTANSVIDLIRSGIIPELIFFIFIPFNILEERLKARGENHSVINSRKKHYYNEIQNGIRLATIANNTMFFDGSKPLEETINLMKSKIQFIGI